MIVRPDCWIWWAEPVTPSPVHLRLLDATERARHAALARSRDRDRFATAAVLLRLAVASHTGRPPHAVAITRRCPDCARPHGKPIVDDTCTHVSVSHAGDRVVVALTESGPLGVDVERVTHRPDLPGMLAHVQSPAERRQTEDPEVAMPPERFFVTWSRKESVLKATGDGLRVPMSRLTVSDWRAPARLRGFHGRDELVSRAHMRDLEPGGGYVAAVTALSARPVTVLERDAGELL